MDYITIQNTQYKTLEFLIVSENKESESNIQKRLIEVIERSGLLFEPSFSGLRIKSFGQRAFMKNQGMRKGYPDLKILKPIGNYQLLFLELKTIKGKLSDEQKERIKELQNLGYAVSVGYGFYDSIYKIKKYLDNEPVLYQEKIVKK